MDYVFRLGLYQSAGLAKGQTKRPDTVAYLLNLPNVFGDSILI